MRKKQELIDIVKCCEQRFNHGPSADWKHSDFGELSREVLLDTQVAISANTLKRIFGKIAVDDDYLPQQATIEALKKYGKYAPSITVLPTELPKKEEPVVFSRPVKTKKYLVLIAGSAIVLIVAALIFFILTKPKVKFSGSISLKNIEGVLPATAYFTLKFPEGTDSLLVNFGDKSPLSYVQPGESTAAHVYLFPGVFKVTLQTPQKEIASTKIAIHSNNWIGYGFRRQKDMPEHYYAFPAEKSGHDSLFHITNDQLFKVGLDTTGIYLTRLANFKPLKNVSDNFIFEAIFKNQLNEKGIYCNSAQFQIDGIQNVIRFKFVNSGCGFRILNIVSEKVFDGTKTNLSSFVIDLNQWNTVKLINRDKHVSLLVNGRELYSGTYNNSLGVIQGVFLEFEGNGYVRKCNLNSLEGKSLYHF